MGFLLGLLGLFWSAGHHAHPVRRSCVRYSNCRWLHPCCGVVTRPDSSAVTTSRNSSLPPSSRNLWNNGTGLYLLPTLNILGAGGNQPAFASCHSSKPPTPVGSFCG